MSTQKLTAFEQTIVAGLADQAGLAASILDTWSDLPIGSLQSPRSLVDAAQLSLADEGATGRLLLRAAALGLISKEQSGFRACGNAKTLFQRLALALYSIEHYRSVVHRDATVAQVVLTKPPRPSVLEQRLSDLGWRISNLDPTEHAFHGMVQSAHRRVVVMTPFFDNVGATWLRELLSYTPHGVDRVLILRSLEDPERKDYPVGFDLISRWLSEEGIRVFNYSIAKAGGGRETFHAKAILCDRNVAYLGSSNVTAASLEHSMEMGVVLHGRAAASVADVIDAVISASTEWV